MPADERTSAARFDVLHRWQTHQGQLERAHHKNTLLQFDWTRDGAQAFEWELLETVPTIRELMWAEWRWMQQQQRSSGGAYNLRDYANSGGITVGQRAAIGA